METENMVIRDAIKACTDRLYSEERERTAQVYVNGLKVFVAYLRGECGLDVDKAPFPALTMSHFINFPAYLTRNYRAKTATVYLAAVDYLLKRVIAKNRWMHPEMVDLMDYEDEKRQMHKKEQNYAPREVTQKDIQKMIEAVKVMQETDVRKTRDIAVILLLASSGLRNFELCALKCRDISFSSTYEKPFLHIESGKGGKQDDVPFGDEGYRAVKEYWKARGWSKPDDPAFARHDRGAGKKHKPLTTATIRDIVHDVRAVAGLESPFTPHYFRHGVATQIIRVTGNIEMARKQLRHSNIATTSGYAHLMKDDLVSAHNKVFGDEKA